MQDMLATLVDELRSVGIAVSVADHLDAAQALSRISLWDRDVVRAALLSTLIKRADHVDTFNLLFELVTGEPREPSADLVSALSDEQLRTCCARQPAQARNICCGCSPTNTSAGSAGWSRAGRSPGYSRPSPSCRQPTWTASAPTCSSPQSVQLWLKGLAAPVRAPDLAPGPGPAPADPAACAAGSRKLAPTGSLQDCGRSCGPRCAEPWSRTGAPRQSGRPCGSSCPRTWTS